MCGIVGTLVFQNNDFRITSDYIARMRDTMAHRGPDGSGTWISEDKRVGLGHRRLSIIDLSESAAQPMSNEDKTLWISFNGEIYNHAEIRAELNQVGSYRWKTGHSDTEVILHAFEQWGIDALQKLRGMFAIALWDTKRNELWLIRDRIGIKPLYYSIHHGRINFASEIKALLADGQQPRKINEESLFHYLSFLTTPAPQTLFAGIKKLPPGTWLCINREGQSKECRYWDVWDHVNPLNNVSEEKISERILDELRTAVKLHKISDVPVGVFLSGGIDSSTNAALFSEDEKEPIKTFTIGYDDNYKSSQNEIQFARLMAKEVRADYHERLLTIDDLMDFLPQMVRLQDEPIADPVCVPVYYVSQLARNNGVKVCQVGEGADELFYGYPGWKKSLELQDFNNWFLSRPFNSMGTAVLGLLDKKNIFTYEAMRRGKMGLPVFWGGAEAFTETQKRCLLAPRLRKKFVNISSWDVLKPIRHQFESKAWEKSHLNWMSYLDLNLRLPELLLMRVDKMSMGVSLEVRVPFLDHKFVELAMSIPESIKTKNGVLKYILKKSVNNLIPSSLVNRKKQGFSVPIYEWFSGKLGEKVIQDLLNFYKKTDFIDISEVMRMIKKKQFSQLWYLLNLMLWMEEYNVN